jgi:hypothetical protein
MKKNILIALIISCVLFASSCATVSYSPWVSLDVSPKTINKTVLVEKFVDNVPESDRKNPFTGFSVTNKKALVNDLSIDVTNAVTADFSNNAVFRTVSRKIDSPDYVIKGEIIRFKGQTKMTNYAKISMFSYVGIVTWLFPIPMTVNSTDVELVLSIYDNKGQLVGKYSGQNDFKARSNMYNNKQNAIGAETDKTFGIALSQIREQILQDAPKYK